MATGGGERLCRVCRCSQEAACVDEHGPCRWIADDLCSACGPGTAMGHLVGTSAALFVPYVLAAHHGVQDAGCLRVELLGVSASRHPLTGRRLVVIRDHFERVLLVDPRHLVHRDCPRCEPTWRREAEALRGIVAGDARFGLLESLLVHVSEFTDGPAEHLAFAHGGRG